MSKKKQESDADLVLRLQDGDKLALVLLVKKWHKLFCDKSYWLVKDSNVAKDIAQDSWVIIMDKISTLKEPKQFKYWAYRIVCNRSMDYLRLQSKHQKRTVSNALEIKTEPVEYEYSENIEVKQKLLQSIQSLPVAQKEIIKLFYLESYSLKQISTILNISIGTAKSRLFHAREKLKKDINIKKVNY
jgi:RNA polymerase sigma-70 factor (ECF subfamily)